MLLTTSTMQNYFNVIESSFMLLTTTTAQIYFINDVGLGTNVLLTFT